MTQTEAKELWPMIKAYAEGFDLEFRFADRDHYDDDWTPLSELHVISSKFEYRRKNSTTNENHEH